MRFAIIIGVICLLLTGVHAQTEYAALLRVERGRVEILRANTHVWRRLPVGAETPFGVGDVLRTDLFGRAWLMLLDDSATVYILPTTDVTLRQFVADVGDTAQVAFAQNGRVIYHIADAARFSRFQIVTDYLTVSQPADLFAVQTLPTQTSVVVASGRATIAPPNTPRTITAEPSVGVRGNQTGVSAPIRLAYPTTFAQLDGVLDGCVGVVQARNQQDLNVRVGPTENYEVIGTIRNGSTVYLMGVSPNRERYRVAYKSHFGWILALEVRHQCDNLPVYGYNTLERLYGVFAPSEAEQAFLTPFFGLPSEDAWFYYGCERDC